MTLLHQIVPRKKWGTTRWITYNTLFQITVSSGPEVRLSMSVSKKTGIIA